MGLRISLIRDSVVKTTLEQGLERENLDSIFLSKARRVSYVLDSGNFFVFCEIGPNGMYYTCLVRSDLGILKKMLLHSG